MTQNSSISSDWIEPEYDLEKAHAANIEAEKRNPEFAKGAEERRAAAARVKRGKKNA